MPTVVITIDTEEDLWGVFRAEGNPVENVSQLTNLQKLFNRFGAVPTYLANWAVVSDPAACVTLQRLSDAGRCEIGMHCHPWNTPPHEQELTPRNSMLSNLPTELIGRKLANLHSLIATRIGITPVSFRAGRWGFNENVARCLARLDYAVDTSVSPTMDWSDYDGPDFTEAIGRPYRFSPDDIRAEDPRGTLLEVPPTIGFWQTNQERSLATRLRLSRGLPKHLHALGVLDRMHVLNHRWLSPEQTSGEDMIRLAKGIVGSGRTILNMCFHSNSLLPGITPFARNEVERDRLLDRITVFLNYAATSGFRFEPLSRAATNTGAA